MLSHSPLGDENKAPDCNRKIIKPLSFIYDYQLSETNYHHSQGIGTYLRDISFLLVILHKVMSAPLLHEKLLFRVSVLSKTSLCLSKNKPLFPKIRHFVYQNYTLCLPRLHTLLTRNRHFTRKKQRITVYISHLYAISSPEPSVMKQERVSRNKHPVSYCQHNGRYSNTEVTETQRFQIIIQLYTKLIINVYLCHRLGDAADVLSAA